ncbi:MAG: hemerythrin family protein [Fibromonadaceae bacterium]|jgi:hemerythrin|nr:hemerythrin family protein [Fibromonadaceae bacterium]
MPFIWLEAMAIGDETIDEQHKQLIKTFNDFMEACKNNRGIHELENSLNFLVDYTVKHFTTEEAIQLKHLYPVHAEHKKIHEGFKVKVAGIVEKFKKEGPTPAMTSSLNFEIGTWIMDHIAKEDRKFAEFLRSKK